MVNKFLKDSAIFKYFDRSFKKIEADLNEKTNKLENCIKSLAEENKLLLNQQLELQAQIKRIVEENNYYSNKINSRIENVNIELLPYNIITNNVKVLVIGFFGAPNTGDELMMQSIINKLDLEKIEVTVMIADNQDFVLNSSKNIKYMHYPRTHTDINTITNYFDKIVFAGGALLDDTEFGNKQTQYTSLYNLLTSIGESIIQKNKELFLIGLSTSNSFSNKEYLRKLNYIVENAKYFSLRDTNSLETLKKYNINCEKIKVIDDLVFSMPNLGYKNDKNGEFSIGMVLVNYVELDTLLRIIEETENFMSKNISKKIKKKIKLIPFYDFCNADITKYKEILGNYNGDIKIEIEKYESDYDRLSNILINCDMLIGMRYHLSLMGLKLGIPTLHIVYDVHRHYINKMNYLLSLFDVEEYKISLKDYNNNESSVVEEKLNKLYKNKEEIAKKNKVVSRKLFEKSISDCYTIIKNIENK